MSSMRDPYGRNAVSHRSAEMPVRNARPSAGAGSYARRPQPPHSGYAQRPTGTRPPQAGRPSGQRPQPTGRPAARRPVRRRRRFPIVPVAVAAVVILAVVIMIAALGKGSGGNLETDTFANNVFINNISLSGYTRDEGYAMMEEIRSQRINATHTITYQDKSWVFHPADVDAWIDYETALAQAWNFGHVGDKSTRKKILASLENNPVNLTCELTYNEGALEAFVDRIAAEVYIEAIDAEVTLTAEKPVFNRQSSNGAELDREAFRENLIALVETGQGDTVLPVKVVVPAVSSDEFNVQPVAKFSTDVTFRNAASRGNVRLALNYFNAMAVYPGDTISFNTVVGPRNETSGFQAAPEYAGNETVEGIGGGVCQASTTLYNAVIRAGMTIIDRKAHSMTVSYVKPSQDAAVEYGEYGKDFVFRNDTDHAIYIYTEVTKELATVYIYGTPPEHRLVLESIIVKEEPTTRKRYVKDTSGKHVYYTTDEPVLKEEGKGACQSQGWLVAYDWETGEEVWREQESFDSYYAGVNVYWKGVHNPVGITTDY